MLDFNVQARQKAIEHGADVRSAEGARLAGVIAPSLQAEHQTKQQLQQLQPEIERINSEAAIRTQQLRDAGMLGLAQQFEAQQRNQKFDLARRGTLGGSRDRERTANLEAQQERGVADLYVNSAQQAESERQQQLAPIQAFQSQLQQGDPFDVMRRQALLAQMQQQGNAMQGQFNIDRQFDTIEQGYQMNKAGMIRDAFSTLALGVQAYRPYNPAGTTVDPNAATGAKPPELTQGQLNQRNTQSVQTRGRYK